MKRLHVYSRHIYNILERYIIITGLRRRSNELCW